MRLATFVSDARRGQPRVGVLVGDRNARHRRGDVCAQAGYPGVRLDAPGYWRRGRVRESGSRNSSPTCNVAPRFLPRRSSISLGCACSLRVPDAEKFLCVGKNYRPHLEELQRTDLIKEMPRRADRLRQAQRLPDRPRGGRRAPAERHAPGLRARAGVRHRQGADTSVKAENAMDYVAGITILNDLTCRDTQKREVASGSRFWTSKNAPGFGPLGPCIITMDEVPDPYDIWVTCSVNGEQRMRVNTSRADLEAAEQSSSTSRASSRSSPATCSRPARRAASRSASRTPRTSSSSPATSSSAPSRSPRWCCETASWPLPTRATGDMSDITRGDPPGFTNVRKTIYHHYIRVDNPKSLIFLSGQLSRDAEGNLVGAGDMAEQTRQCIRNMRTVLEAAGGTLDDIVSIVVYTTDMRAVQGDRRGAHRVLRRQAADQHDRRGEPSGRSRPADRVPGDRRAVAGIVSTSSCCSAAALRNFPRKTPAPPDVRVGGHQVGTEINGRAMPTPSAFIDVSRDAPCALTAACTPAGTSPLVINDKSNRRHRQKLLSPDTVSSSSYIRHCRKLAGLYI